MQPIGDLIRIKKSRGGLKKPLEIYELFGEWGRLTQAVFAGKKVGCAPRFLKGRTLIIEANGASAVSELRLRQRQLIKKINDHFGRKMVERIVFRLNA